MDKPSNKSLEQKLPHSGDLGLEKPENEYDNTSLEEAYKTHLTDTDGNVIIPEPNAIPRHKIDSEETSTDTQQGQSRRRFWKIGGITTGVVAATTATVLAISLNLPKEDTSKGEENIPTPDPKPTSQEALPEPTQESEPVSVNSFEISGDLSPEEAANTLVEERLSAWFMAGASTDTADEYLKEGGSSDYIKSVAKENASTISNALFIPGWQSDTSLSHYVEWSEEQNAATLENWILTSKSGLPQDKEPYTRSIGVDSVSVDGTEDTKAYVTVNTTDHDNADKNSVGVGERISRTADQMFNGNKNVGKITLEKIDNTWKIASIEWSSIQ